MSIWWQGCPLLNHTLACFTGIAPIQNLYQVCFQDYSKHVTLLSRYYAIATPSATQRLLFGLLEAPPSWAPDALDAAVQLVELLRAAEDYATGMRV
jgi:hypothetical protein